MTDRQLAGSPDAPNFVEEAVAGAHYPSLLMMLVHLTGEPSLLTPERRPAYTDFVANASAVDPHVEVEVRELAARALKAHLYEGVPIPPQPDDATLLQMMVYLAGREIPEHYLGFLQEELGIGNPDPRRPDWTPEALAPESAYGVSAVVIGAGMSGLLAAIRFKQAGIPVRIIEKNPDVGGTWLENTYPGCRVDSNNQTYSYSFALNPTWPQRFSTQPEILAYFQRVAREFGLYDEIEFDTRVTRMVFDEAAAHWEVESEGPEGKTLCTATYVVSAVGQLNTPLIPDLPGADLFAGPAFHSARWRHDVDLTGKRVAVVGTGASAFQFVPEIAETAGEVRIFQRTPPWLMPTPEYHEDVPEAERWLLASGPYYANWYRFWQFWMFVDGLHEQVIADPEFDGGGLAISPSNAMLREACEAWIKAQAEGRPDLLPMLIPRYPVGGKRALRDNGTWIKALKRPDVHIVTDPIVKVDPSGLVTRDGTHHDVDVLIYGTGFRASDFLSSIEIIGRDGVTLSERWQGEARAYLGITIPGFPNLFCVYGPNTNLVVNGSIIFFSECAVSYILKGVRWMLANGVDAVDLKPGVHDSYYELIDRANANRAWGVEGVSSWYKNQSGRVTQNWPLSTAEYWLMTKSFIADEYEPMRGV